MDKKEFLEKLAGHIRSEYKTNVNASSHWGCHESLVSQVLSGRKMIPMEGLKDVNCQETKTEITVRKNNKVNKTVIFDYEQL